MKTIARISSSVRRLPLASEEIAQVGDELSDVAPELLHPLR
jgi:hypothetical protein